MTISQFKQFSLEAAKIWEEIPVEFQDTILSNVLCSPCRVRWLNQFPVSHVAVTL